jgi:thiol-disulfide isomerase/thioredoxin
MMRACAWKRAGVMAVLGLFACGAVAQVGPASALSSVRFPLRDIEGQEWNRADLQGKVVLLDFWATWCTPCIGELPFLERAYGRHQEDGLVILAVSVDQTEPATLRRWLRMHSVSWPQLHDNRGFGGAVPLAFGVEMVPRSFLFDRAGRLVAVDLRGQAFEAVMKALVESPGPPPVGCATNGPQTGAGID